MHVPESTPQNSADASGSKDNETPCFKAKRDAVLTEDVSLFFICFQKNKKK